MSDTDLPPSMRAPEPLSHENPQMYPITDAIRRHLGKVLPRESVRELLAGAWREAQRADDVVWIGDLSGFRAETTTDDAEMALEHRCGWRKPLHPADWYLGNMVTFTTEHRAAGCAPKTDG